MRTGPRPCPGGGRCVIGLPEDGIQRWLLQLADHIKQSAEEGRVPPPVAVPETLWEWRARFPELHQFLGGRFSQDMPDEFEDHTSAVRDHAGSVAPTVPAGLAGEVAELLALGLEEVDCAVAVAERGMEVEPPDPYTASGRPAVVAGLLAGPRAEYDRGGE